MSTEVKAEVTLGCVAYLPSHPDVPMTVIRHYTTTTHDDEDDEVEITYTDLAYRRGDGEFVVLKHIQPSILVVKE